MIGLWRYTRQRFDRLWTQIPISIGMWIWGNELPLKEKISPRAASSKVTHQKETGSIEKQVVAVIDSPKPARRSPGRTRSDASRVSVLRTALKLLETNTLQQISIEAIAREAGVGKATIYRWWPSKASVVIDAFIQYHVAHSPFVRNVPVREALSRHLYALIEEYSGRYGTLVAQILAEGQADPAVLQELRERFFHGRRQIVLELMLEGQQSGEIRSDLDASLAIDMMYAPIYMRLLVGHLPLDQNFAKQHVAMVIELFCIDATRQ